MCILLSPGVSWTHPSLSCSLEVSKNQKNSSFCSTGGFRIWPKGFAKDDTGSPSCYRPLAAACSSSMCSKAGRGKKQWFSQCNFCQMALCLSCQHIPFKGAAPLNHLWLTSPDFCHFWKCPFPPWKREHFQWQKLHQKESLWTEERLLSLELPLSRIPGQPAPVLLSLMVLTGEKKIPRHIQKLFSRPYDAPHSQPFQWCWEGIAMVIKR